MHEEAVLKLKHTPRSRTIAIPPATVGYEQFRQMAWTATQELLRHAPNPGRGIVPIAQLRRALRQVPSALFDEHVLRLERNGLVYLIPPERPDALDESDRQDCLPHPAGDLRAFILWMHPKTQPAYFRD